MSMPVSHIMRTRLVVCEESTLLRKVAELMRGEKVGSVLINRGEEWAGIITMTDILDAVLAGRELDATAAKDIMSQPLDTIPQDMSVEDALKAFSEKGRQHLVVMSGSKAAGILKKSVAERFKGLTGLYSFSPKSKSLPFRRSGG